MNKIKKHHILIFIVALLLRLIVLYELASVDPIEPRSDMRSYYFRAQGLLDGIWPEPRVFFQQPLMPLLIAFSFKLFGVSTFAPRLLNCFIGALACALFLAPATELFNRRVGLISAGLLAIYRGAVYHDTAILDVSFSTLTVVLMLWGISRPSIRRSLIVGLVATLGVLGRSHLLASLAGMIAWLLFKKQYKAGFTLALTLLIFLLPIVARNAHYGTLNLTSQGPYTLWLGNNPLSNGLYNNRLDDDAQQLAQRITEQEDSFSGKIIRYIVTSPFDWALLTLRKIVLFFFVSDGVGYNGVYLLLDLENSWLLNFLPGYPIFLILAFGGLLRRRKYWSEFMPLAMIYLPYAFITIIFVVFSRYRVPITTILILGSAVYINELLDTEWPLIKRFVTGRVQWRYKTE